MSALFLPWFRLAFWTLNGLPWVSWRPFSGSKSLLSRAQKEWVSLGSFHVDLTPAELEA